MKIKWSEKAKEELANTYYYIEDNWSSKEIKRLSVKIEATVNFIKEYPFSYPIIRKGSVRKAVILKYNSMYYRVKNDEIEILSFFSNRQKPKDEI